jgi:hypothetical protein
VTEIRFEPLPEDGRGRKDGRRSHAKLIAETLRVKPGEWAVVKEYDATQLGNASVYAWAIKTARRSTFAPAGAFEAVTRKVGGKVRVYASYVGGAGEPS